MADEDVVVLYSGGTDSTCAAVLMAQRFQRIHLVTLDRAGFHQVEHSRKGAEMLARAFPSTTFVHRILRIDRLFTRVAFADYVSRIRRFGFFMLGNCTFCALSNHFRALAYCIEHGISHVADGVTRELPYLPSHMEKPIARLKEVYRQLGLEYHTPVYDFDIPREMSFFDRFLLPEEGKQGIVVDPDARTTGRYLHDLGILPTENIKGSSYDRGLQYRCFQYVLHNMVAFWTWLPRGKDYASYEARILDVYEDAILRFEPHLRALQTGGRTPALDGLFGSDPC